MSARWTIWRAISAGLALCLLGLAAKCFVDARKFRKQFEDWETAKPMDAVVDLSTPGEIVVPFHQTCSSSHSEVVALRVPASALQGGSITQLLQGASARIEVRRKQGTNVVESAELDLSWTGDLIDGAIPVFFVSPFRRGEYEATVSVTAGAPGLKGVSQRLEGRYLLCGMEAMPAEIAKFGGIGSSGLASLVGMVLLYRLARVPIRTSISQTASPNGGPAAPVGNSGAGEGPPSVS